MNHTHQILILCTANSARSQMAEGMLRHLANDRVDVYSAGTRPSVVNPYAIEVMAEQGIDISDQHSKSMEIYLGKAFDTVITVCDDAAESCPVFPGRAQRIHWSLPDPAAVDGSDADKRAAFRAIRDTLEEKLTAWLAEQQPA